MWLLPSLSSSPASADSALPCGECGPLPAAWATSSGTPTLRPSSWRGWLTRPWSARLFGSATFATWTAAASRLGWTSSPPASPARTSRPPAREPDSVEHEAGCGPRSSESPRSSSPSSSSSRTWQPFAVLAEGTWTLPQASLFAPSALFLETWPRSGMTRSGQAFELQRPVRHTSGADGSVWPTCLARDAKSGERVTGRGSRNGRPLNEVVLIGAYAANLYPTPSSTPYGSSQNEGQVPHERPSAGTPSLETWAKYWQTPGTDSFRQRSGDRSGEMGLDQQARFFHLGLRGQGIGRPGNGCLTDGHGSLPASHRRKLNACFEEWLMGYRIGWTLTAVTASAVSATPSSPPRPRSGFVGASRRLSARGRVALDISDREAETTWTGGKNP